MKNHNSMVIIGAILIVFALVIAIVPQFTSCESQGKAISLPNGMTIPMKCYWTGQSELVVAVLLLIVGILIMIGKRRETEMFLSIMGIFLGVAAILLPAWLIGTCAPPMLCYTVMRTTLLIAGPLVAITGIIGLLISVRAKENGQS